MSGKNIHGRKYLFNSILKCFLILILLGCNSSEGIFTVPIKELLDNPRKYENKVITISGNVTDVFSIMLVKTYTLSDDTGQITVVTSRILPMKGEKLKVRGIIKEAFSLGDMSLTVFKEQN